MSEIDTQKKQIRKQIKDKLALVTPKQRLDYSKKIIDQIVEMDEFKKAGVVMTFLSLPHEVETAQLILQAWRMGKTVVVPKISWQQRHMIAVEINSLETGFSIDTMGLKNPTTGVPFAMEDIDIVITPGLAFDQTGCRLGRGGGYFDRFFANENLKAIKCAVGFSVQVVQKLPTDDTDIAIDCLVTEKQTYRF